MHSFMGDNLLDISFTFRLTLSGTKGRNNTHTHDHSADQISASHIKRAINHIHTGGRRALRLAGIYQPSSRNVPDHARPDLS